MRDKESLLESFKEFFDVDLATSDSLKREVYAIRYRVYCEEFKYERSGDFPDGLEHDSYDGDAIHCLIRHKATGKGAGCVRLVPASRGALLPFEKVCAHGVDEQVMQALRARPEVFCEISRLAVDGAFRRRASEARTRFGEVDAIDCSHRERRTFSLISLVAFLAATSLTDLAGRGRVFAMMEPFLPRMLEKSGIYFQKAGDNVDYHGLRAPYFGYTKDALKSMQPELREIYNYIHVLIAQQYEDAVAVS